MTHEQKINNIKKKKIVIIAMGMIALIFMFLILTVTVLYFKTQNNELSRTEGNILYYSEGKNAEKEEEDKNLLVVGIDNKNDTNENKPDENVTGTNNVDETNSNQNENNINNETTPKVVNAPYYIKINNQANVVTVYKKDSKGEYKTPVKAFICSIGDATPESGVYSISDKYTWRLLQGDVYGQYACRITGHILFHSVPYIAQDKSTLEWWEYDKLGTKASLGCIRLKVEDVKWIYDNCVPGTKVEFYSSSDPGPLGKPTAPKISGDEEVRNWDPTDPDPNNPWKEYLKQKETDKNEKEASTEPVAKNENNTINDNKVSNSISNSVSNNTIQKNDIKENTNSNIDKNNNVNTTNINIVNTIKNNENTNNTSKDNTIKTNQIENNINQTNNI